MLQGCVRLRRPTRRPRNLRDPRPVKCCNRVRTFLADHLVVAVVGVVGVPQLAVRPELELHELMPKLALVAHIVTQVKLLIVPGAAGPAPSLGVGHGAREWRRPDTLPPMSNGNPQLVRGSPPTCPAPLQCTPLRCGWALNLRRSASPALHRSADHRASLRRRRAPCRGAGPLIPSRIGPCGPGPGPRRCGPDPVRPGRLRLVHARLPLQTSPTSRRISSSTTP